MELIPRDQRSRLELTIREDDNDEWSVEGRIAAHDENELCTIIAHAMEALGRLHVDAHRRALGALN